MNALPIKTNERLTNVINKLKSQLIADDARVMGASFSSESRKNNNEVIESLNMKTDNDELDVPDNESCKSWGMQEDKSLSKSYLMWENNANLCWLDSSMSLLVHSKTLFNLINDNSSQIAKIIKGYEAAISVFNDYTIESTLEERLQKAKDILQKVQETVLAYLKPILKCKEGEPDSAFCSLLNLISEDKQIKNAFLVEYSWLRNCIKCAAPRVKNNKKTIITLSKVKTFNPCSPVSLYKCPICESPDQEMEIKYKTLPQCFIFHFENGAGEGELDSLDFEIDGRKYKLSGLITLEKSRDLTVSHFVTWVRDIATDSWLECNDLNSDILSFGVVPPMINLQDLYIVMYEALDEKGTTINLNVIEVNDLNSPDIPLIDLSDEEDDKNKKQENQIEKEVSDSMLLKGLFKHDETDYDGDAKMSKRFDQILSDSIFSSKNTLVTSETNASEYSNSSSFKENKVIPTEKKVTAGNFDLQENASLTSDEDFTVKSQSYACVEVKNSIAVNTKSQINDNVETPISNEKNPSNSEMASFVKPALDKTVKTLEDFDDKPLNGISSSIEKLLVLTGAKDATPRESNIPSRRPENLFEDDHTFVSLDEHLSTTVKKQDKKSGSLRKIPNEYEASKLNGDDSGGRNNINMNDHINEPRDCILDAVESCARTSGLPIPRKKLKKIEHAVKKFKTSRKEKSEGTAVCQMDNGVTTLAFQHNSDTPKKPRKADICRPTLKKNPLVEAISKPNDLLVLDSEFVNTSETKTGNINNFSEKSCTLSNDFPSENNEEIEFVDHNLTSNNLQITFNSISEDAIKPTDNYVGDEKVLNSNLIMKQNQNGSKSLEKNSSKVSENGDTVLSMHQTRDEDNKNVELKEYPLSSSLRTNEQQNLGLVESQLLRLGIKQKVRDDEENVSVFLNHQLETKKSTSKMPVVELTKLTECEIAKYTLGRVNFEEPKQSKSLEEITKTVVVKVEKTDFNSILMQTSEQASPPKAAKFEPIRKSSRISARMKKKSLQEIISKKSKLVDVQPENISIKENNSSKRKNNVHQMVSLTEVDENSLKNKNTSKKASRTNSTSDVHANVFSPMDTKRQHSKDSSADQNIKPKRRRTKSIEKNNAIIKSRHLSPLSLETTSSTPKVVETSNVLATFPTEYPSVNKKPVNLHETAGNKIKPFVSPSESNIFCEQEDVTSENTGESDKNKECSQNCECNDLQLHELIENSTNCVFANVFQFFNLHKMDF